MSERVTYSFSDVAEFRKGINYSSTDYVEGNTGIPFISIKCLLKGGGFDFTGIKFLKDRSENSDKLKTGELLFSITDLTRAGDIVGSPLLVPEKYNGSIASMDLIRVKPNELLLNTEYLYYLMMTNKVRNYFVNHSAGSTVLHLEISSIPKLIINLPVLTQQRKIARILSTADAVIEKTQATIAKYKAIKQGMLHDLFTRGIDITTGKLRPKYEAASEFYKESKLGMVPKDWEEKTIGEVCSMKSGEGITSKSIFEIEDYPVFGGNGLRGFTSSFTHEGEYILVGRQGALCGNITRVRGKFYASEHAVVVTVENEINVDWLSQQLEDKNLNQYSEASAQPGLSVNKILKLPIIKPSFNEQNKIAERLLSMDQKLQAEQNCLHKLQSIKQGLMADLLSGKRQVKLPEEAERMDA